MQLASKHPLHTCRPKHGIRGREAGEPCTVIFYIHSFIIRFIAEEFSLLIPYTYLPELLIVVAIRYALIGDF